MSNDPHATEAMVLEGYPAFWREGNGFADAAAKHALALHPRDHDVESVVDGVLYGLPPGPEALAFAAEVSQGSRQAD